MLTLKNNIVNDMTCL